MKCRRYRKLLIPYLEGSLPGDLLRCVGEHLLRCPECARELEDIKAVSATLAGVDCPAVEPLSDTRERVMAKIAEKPRVRWWEQSVLPTYSAAAAVTLIFVAGLTLMELKNPQGFDQAPPARVAASVEKPSVKAVPPEKNPAPPAEEVAKAESEEPGSPLVLDLEALPALPKNAAGGKSMPVSLPEQKASAKDAPRVASAKIAERADTVSGFQPVQAPPGGAQQAAATPPAAAYYNNRTAGFGNASPRESLAPRALSAPVAADMGKAEKEVRNFPTSRAALLNLLAAARGTGHKEEEYSAAERLTRLYPNEASYWFARGQAAEKTDRRQDAIDSYSRAVDLKLESPDIETAKSRLTDLGR